MNKERKTERQQTINQATHKYRQNKYLKRERIVNQARKKYIEQSNHK